MKANRQTWLLMLGMLSGMACATPTVTATASTEVPSLRIGDPAPAIRDLIWIKGSEITKYKPGRVYVIEFWASWCAPCNEAMPQLSALQRRYADKLTILAIDVFEEFGGGKQAEVNAVKAFVDKKGDLMSYTVAMDDPQKEGAFHAWITASGSYGVPGTFIVDQRGRVVWMGHVPSSESYAFELALADTLSDKPDLARSRAVQSRMKDEVAVARLMAPMRRAVSRQDYKAAATAARSIVTTHPEIAAAVFPEQLGAMLHVNEVEALAYAKESSERTDLQKQMGVADKTQFLGMVGGTIARERGLSQGTYQTAADYLRKATSAAPENVWNWASLAELDHALGNLDQAIDAQQRAISAASKQRDFPADSLADLRRTLAHYRVEGD